MPHPKVDSMLGRLCRWLRCLGVDAESVDVRTPRAEMPALTARHVASGVGDVITRVWPDKCMIHPRYSCVA